MLSIYQDSFYQICAMARIGWGGGGSGQGRNRKRSFESSIYIFCGVQNTCFPQLPSTQNLLSPELHSVEEDSTSVPVPSGCFYLGRPQRQGGSGGSAYVETYGGVGSGQGSKLCANLCIWTMSTPEGQQYTNCLTCGPHTLHNRLMALSNYLAIFQVNVKHQRICWSDSQKLTGGLNLITLTRGVKQIVVGATSGRKDWSPSPQNKQTPVLGT